MHCHGDAGSSQVGTDDLSSLGQFERDAPRCLGCPIALPAPLRQRFLFARCLELRLLRVPGAAIFVFAVAGLRPHVVGMLSTSCGSSGSVVLIWAARVATRGKRVSERSNRASRPADLVPTVRPSGRACPPAASSCSPSCGPARLQRFGSPRGARRPGRLRQHFRLLLARWPRAGGAAPYFSKRLRSWTSKLSRFFVLPLTSCVVRFVAVSLTAASIVNFATLHSRARRVNFFFRIETAVDFRFPDLEIGGLANQIACHLRVKRSPNR